MTPLQTLVNAIQTGDYIGALPDLLGILLALVAGITFHEFSHAFTAYRLGDPTPRYQGRVTLNPAAHLDPIGMLLFVVAGFGWGRPVQFNPYAIRMNPRVGSGLVAFAGPVANILLGVGFGLLLRLLIALFRSAAADSVALQVILQTLVVFVFFNFVLAIFNLIPIPPLDGSKILPALLPPDMAYSLERFYAQLGPYSLLLLFALFWLPGNIIGQLLIRPVAALFSLVVGLPFF